jgi:hypothetical protein
MIERDAPGTEPAYDVRQRAALDAAVRAQGLERFAYFLVSGEGTFFPNGLESASGFVIDEHGRVFSFWTAWDAEGERLTFSEWEQVEPRPHWERRAEYRRARAAVGLPT